MIIHTSAHLRNRVKNLFEQCRIRRPPIPVQAIARKLGIEIRYVAFEEDVSGVLYRDKQDTIIGVNSLHHPNRQRFTIAHEIGHFLLHGMDVHVDKGFQIALRDSASSKAIDPAEIDANRFAAEFLIPKNMIVQDAKKFLDDLEDNSGLEQLADLYSVSSQAMAFRLSNLKLLNLIE